MIYVNPIFNTLKIKRHLARMILLENYSAYDDISFPEKCETVALLMEAAGQGGEAECLTESNDIDTIISALKKALNYVPDANYDLAFTLKNSAVNYYDETMRTLFESQLENLKEYAA